MAKKDAPVETVVDTTINYKNTEFLKQHITKFNKITPRYYSGTDLKTQKKIAREIKRARYMALLPFVLDLKIKNDA